MYTTPASRFSLKERVLIKLCSTSFDDQIVLILFSTINCLFKTGVYFAVRRVLTTQILSPSVMLVKFAAIWNLNQIVNIYDLIDRENYCRELKHL